jgi:hypothetical protein
VSGDCRYFLLQVLYNGGKRAHIVEIKDFAMADWSKGEAFVSAVSVAPGFDSDKQLALDISMGAVYDSGRRAATV